MSLSPIRTDAFLRLSRRSMYALLGIILALGTLGVGLALWPDGALASFSSVAWAVPIAVVLVGGALRASAGGVPFGPEERRAVLEDEWRRASMDRALRVAFGTVLVAQLPLAYWLSGHPAHRAVVAMAVATIALALAALAASFLYFDGDARDA